MCSVNSVYQLWQHKMHVESINKRLHPVYTRTGSISASDEQVDTSERPPEGSNNQQKTEDTKDNKTMNEDDLE